MTEPTHEHNSDELTTKYAQDLVEWFKNRKICPACAGNVMSMVNANLLAEGAGYDITRAITGVSMIAQLLLADTIAVCMQHKQKSTH